MADTLDMPLDTADTFVRGARDGSGPVLAPGVRLGRYLVLERVGAGGMGEVYAAYDPQLDRRVALKVLRGASSRPGQSTPSVETTLIEARERMIREAQAMARLQHPNVAAVHDAGEIDGHAFIAMEFVPGHDADQWRRAGHRSWREILGIFLAAGRGLAAAHAAQLVHRDFKARNVLVGDDGRVRVVDFGIARIPRHDDAARAAAPARPAEAAAGVPDKLTQDGALLGTPAYMAPEQWSGGQVDARSDQFSFCASLWEALYDQLPFNRPLLTSLGEKLEVIQPPKGARLPAHVHAALLRGLSIAPSERFPSMDALLEVLGRDVWAKRRRALLAGAGAVTVLALAGGPFLYRHYEAGRCERETATALAAWTPERQARLAAGFEGLAIPFASAAWARTRELVGGYLRGWSDARISACAFAPQLKVKSYACLDRRLARVHAVLDRLERPNPKIAESAVRAALALEPVRPCVDVRALAAMQDEATPAGVRDGIARGHALYDFGQYAQAKEALAPVLATDAVKGRALAEALRVHALAQDKLGEVAASEEAMYRAALVAIASGDDVGAADAFSYQAQILSRRQSKLEAASRQLALAEALVSSVDGAAVERARVELTRGAVHESAGKWSDALAAYETAVAAFREVQGPDSDAERIALASAGNMLIRLGRYDEALSVNQQVLDQVTRAYGKEHPEYATQLMNRGITLKRLGRTGDAIAIYEQVIALRERLIGPEDVTVAGALANLADALRDSPRRAEALAVHARALAIFEKRLGPETLQAAIVRLNVCALLGDLGRTREALEACTRAVATTEKISRQHGALGVMYTSLAEIEMDLGRFGDALAHIQRAKALATESADPYERGVMDFVHARAVWKVSRDVKKVRELAMAAETQLAASGPRGETDLAALREWRAKNALPSSR